MGAGGGVGERGKETLIFVIRLFVLLDCELCA